MRLAHSDLSAILGFLTDADGLAVEEAFAPEVLGLLRRLIPCDDVAFQEADVEARRFTDAAAELYADEDAEYWDTGPCPIMTYRARTGDVAAIRMSDLVSRRRYHELPVYREYFRPRGIDHVLDLGLSAAASSYRTLLLVRGTDAPDFSERERTILEVLRPHLRAREARATMLAMVAGRLRALEEHGDDDVLLLTTREREILAMVAAGKTNAEIGAGLWISPGTVKKHLENIYLKLGVGSRAAAATRLKEHSVQG